MNTANFWEDKVEYVQNLAKEVADLKGVLQDISQQVRRIERRIDLLLPEGAQTKNRKTASGGGRVMKPLTMSKTQARQTIKRMNEHLCNDKPIANIQTELRNMNVKRELTPIAREFGMTNTALPPKTELIKNIITRLRQSVMLTENIRKMPRVTTETHVAKKEKRYGD